MDVSVIIINYNTLSLTQDCIDSVFEKTSGVTFEVILVDNASVDGSKEWFVKDNRIRYVYSDKNLGFGKGNNLGYGFSQGKYVLFLNSDTQLLNNAIKEFFDYMESAPPTVGCCGSLLYDKEGTPMHSYASLLSVGYFAKLYVLGAVKQETRFMKNYFKPCHTGYPMKVGYITGADIFMRRCLATSMGLFDPDFFMYYEESEMQYRYTKAGYEMHCIDMPKIRHLEGGSVTKNMSIERALTFLESEVLYCKKTMSLLAFHIVGMLRLLKIPRIMFGRFNNKEKLQYIKALIKSV